MAIKTYNDQNFIAIANAIRSKSKNPTTYKPSEMAAAISAIESGFELLPQDTVSGAIANFPDGSDGYPVVELIADINYKQAGSTECNISKQGKNLLLEDCTQYNANSYITQPFILKPGQYTISFQCSETASAIYVRKGSTIALGTTAYLYKYNVNEFSFTADEETYYYFQFYKSAPGWSSPPNNSQLEVGSAASDFVPYSAPEVKTIDLGRTVYGGSLNVTTGELTSTLDSSGDPLPTPEVYQLEPEEVKTLLGVNNISADTGNVSLTYRADVDLYIAKKIAEGA